MAAMETDGIRLSGINPKFLHSNSTSHTWPFGAIAELIDNAYDPDVNAKQIWIDKIIIKNNICLTFTDNGKGMALEKLHRMLSFGFSDKVAVRGHAPIGLYGNGFKSGSMRLGKDAIVFTKNESGMHVGMLSQTYLEKINAEHVLVPIISFNKHKQLVQTPDSDANMQAITTYSLLNSETEILAELETITGRKGTRIIIWNLRRDKSRHLEFDFDYNDYDIRIPAETDGMRTGYQYQNRVDQVAPDSDNSLRAYCSILYLKPRMQIVLRGQKVQTQLVSKSLAYIEKDVYKPQCSPKTINITFGYNCQDKQHYGIMMYHNNRLIKAYERVGCQLKNKGVGIVGVVECNFLKPTHNKQDFDYTNEYRLTLSALGTKLGDYWNVMKEKKNSDPFCRRIEDIKNIPDQNWVQCDSCLKWRKLPDGVKISKKLDWCCSMNMDPQFRDCSVPEEPGANDDVVTSCTYEKTPKKKKPACLEQMVPGKSTGLSIPQNMEVQPSVSSGQRDFEPNQSQETDINKRKPACPEQMVPGISTGLSIPQNMEVQPSVSSGQRDFEPNQTQETDINKRDCCVPEKPGADNDITQEKTDERRESERLQQMAADKPPTPCIPQSKEMQPSVSSGQRDLQPNQSQETDIKKSCKRLISYESTPAKKQKLTESNTTDLLQSINADDDVIIIEEKCTAEPKMNHENMNFELHVKQEEEGASNDYSSQGNQPMPDSIQREMETSHQTHHQESSNDTMEQENKRLKTYCGELSFKVQELEKQISDLWSNQVKKEVSHEETQTDMIRPNTEELSLKLLAAKYEQALKVISKLKAQCEVLQKLKAEPGTGPQNPAENSSKVDAMTLELDSGSTEHDQYRSEP